MKRTLTAILLLAWTATAQTFPGGSPLSKPLKQARYIMGTVCEITVYPPSGDAAGAEAAIHASFEELKRIDALLSNWKEDSELMRANRAAAAPGKPRPQVAVGKELFARLEKAVAIARETDGRFDPTVGPLVRAWGFLPSGVRPKGRARAVAEARARVGWQKVRLDPSRHTVEFAVPGMEIDLGGIAKGYAAERAVEVLRQSGIRQGLVNLGGSSLVALGNPRYVLPEETPGSAPRVREGWPVYIRDPRNPARVVRWTELHDGETLASSGTYEKTVGRGAARRSHIINPQTGQAVGGTVGVTLVMGDAEAADALTKPFFFLQSLRTRVPVKLLKKHPEASVILVAARRGKLLTEAAGYQPERFQKPWRARPENHDAEAH